MQTSKNKSSYAYAKIGKQKNKIAYLEHNTHKPRNSKKQMHKPDIFDMIQADEGQYVDALIRKQQKQIKKSRKSQQKQNMIFSPWEQSFLPSGSNTPLRRTHSQQQIFPNSTKSINQSKMTITQNIKGVQKVENGKKIINKKQISQLFQEKTQKYHQQDNNFLAQLDNYLDNLENIQKTNHNRNSSNLQREFLSNQQQKYHKQQLNKYDSLNLKYQKCRGQKDTLIKKNGIQERQINQLKLILKGMYTEIQELNYKLNVKDQENEKMKKFINHISSQFQSYLNYEEQEEDKKQNRQSYLSQSQNIRLSRQQWTMIQARRSSINNKQKRPQYFLKKSGKIPRYKTCQINDDQQIQKRASIYNQSSFQ